MTGKTDFDRLLRKAWKEGMKTHDLKFKSYKSVIANDYSIPYEVRYLPSLEEKVKEVEANKHDDSNSDSSSAEENTISHDAKEEAGIDSLNGSLTKAPEHHFPPSHFPSHDPFAPPRNLVVTSIPPEFVCMLNKYSLEKGHFLVITDDFVPQTGHIREQDLVMLHDVVQRPSKRMYAFMNSGPDAGASQEHRHFQFMEVPDVGEDVWPDAIYRHSPAATEAQTHPHLSVAHFLLPILDSSRRGLMETYERLRKLAHEAAGTENEKMPYNFLIAREYMLILPRRKNKWQEEISIGGTCLVGSIPVEDIKYIDMIKKVGFVEVMREVGYPK